MEDFTLYQHSSASETGDSEMGKITSLEQKIQPSIEIFAIHYNTVQIRTTAEISSLLIFDVLGRSIPYSKEPINRETYNIKFGEDTKVLFVVVKTQKGILAKRILNFNN